jgi:uncharacterized protein
MRSLSFVLFLGVVVLVDVTLHWYLWARLVRDPAWPERMYFWLTSAVIAAGVGLPLGLLAGRFLPRPISEPIASVAYTWMGVVFLLLILVVAGDVLRFAILGATMAYAKLSAAPVDPVRREVLARGIAAAAGVASVGLTGASLRSGLGEVDAVEVPVKLPRLPAALSGLTLVQLSDVHIGPLLGDRFVRSIVEKANAQRPDIVVITGDLVDGDVAQLRPQMEAFAKLRARYGVYFVTGNHEYYSGVDEWMPELARLGIRVLRNERVAIGDSSSSIDLAGIDDFTAARFGEGHGPDLKRALEGRDPGRELVLLAHQPKAIGGAAIAGVGLQLSGHTHGGQIWPFRHAVGLVQPYVEGLHRHGELTQIYVSRGTGFWGPPMRLAAPAEITKLVLTT